MVREKLTFEQGVTKANGKPYYRTWTGQKFFPTAPTADMINYWDICHSLSIVRRFHGHTDVGVSVGNHTLFMLEAAVAAKVEIQMLRVIWAHDSPEAYYNDLASPLKHAVEMIGYRELEHQCETIIFKMLGIGLYNVMELKKWDLASLAAEVRSFSSGNWHLQIKENKIIPYKLKLKTDKQVEKELLKWFKRLFPSHWLGASHDAYLSRCVGPRVRCE